MMPQFIGTEDPLAADAIWTSKVNNTNLADRITGVIFSDQIGVLKVEQSGNGTDWDLAEDINITASAGAKFSVELVAPYVRLQYTNGTTAQTAFRIYSRFSSAGSR